MSLPNLREYNNNDLTESPSDSEELLAAKYEEWMWQRWEAHEEWEAREHLECEAQEASKQAEHKEWEEWEARKRRGHEEREKTVCEEVHRGKVSAQRLR